MTTVTMVDFCVVCFATNIDGSSCPTGTSGRGTENYCTNCGGGSIIHITEQQANSIRSGASWIGKRFYPHHEDYLAASQKSEEHIDLYTDLIKPYIFNIFPKEDYVDVYRYNNEIVQISYKRENTEYVLYQNFP